jgi:hypothetical protein
VGPVQSKVAALVHGVMPSPQTHAMRTPSAPQTAKVVVVVEPVVVVVVDVVVVDVVVVTQLPWSQTSSLVHADTQALLAQARHWVASQPPQLMVPPQPSETVPQVPGAHDVAGVQQAPLEMRAPAGQQSPNSAVAFLTMGFAQFRLQQLTFVEQIWLFGLQPPARASRAMTSMMLATSARRAVRQSDFASGMGRCPSGADAPAHRGLKSRRKNDGMDEILEVTP